MLTPDELKGKVFQKNFRGYNPAEVDEFIGKVLKEFEYLYMDNMNMKDTIERISSKLEYYQRMETTLQSTLTMAQNAADEVRENSTRMVSAMEKETQVKSQKILEDARNEAHKILLDAEDNYRKTIADAEERSRKIIQEADTKAVDAKNEYTNLTEKTEIFRKKFLSMLETQMDMMKNYQTAFAVNNSEENTEQK